jgi:glycosyltransferase involved in cell wall biosynthesis
MMQITKVIDSLAYGGAEHSLVALVPYLIEAGASISIVCLYERDSNLVDRALQSGATVVTAPEGSVLTQARWLRARLRANLPDVIHTTLARSDLVGRIASIGSGIPVLTSLVSVKDDATRARTSGVPRWKLQGARVIDRATGRWWTDHFHAVSEAVLVNAQQRLGITPERITVVPRGRDPKVFRPSDAGTRRSTRAGLGIPTGHEFILHVGRQEPAKGLVHLVDAFAEVHRRRPKSTLVLAGPPGATTPAIRERIDRHRLAGSVKLVGCRSDIPQLLGAADVLVLPSLWEGLPNAVIEAMATATPVVASDIDAVRNTVEPGRSALLATPGEAQALARQVLRLLADSDLRLRLGERGREVFLQRYTIQTVATQMLELYEHVSKSQGCRLARLETVDEE